MENIFLGLLDMSLSAGLLVAVVLVLRRLLRNAPKFIRCILWAMVGLRLVCPFSPESVLSLMPADDTVSHSLQSASAPAVSGQTGTVPQNTVPVMPSPTSDGIAAGQPAVSLTAVLAAVWLAGVIAMAAWGVISYLRLRRATAASLRLRDDILLCDDIESPFILGLFRPRIFVPSGMDAEQLACVEAHELAHIQRKDHWWKPLGFALLALHWFNPAIWLAYVLLCRDIEYACDEKVIRSMSMGDRREYSRALLSCSIPHRSIAACPLAFGEVGVKERVRSVLNYKKPVFWVILGAVAACIVLAVCFLTDPPGKRLDAETEAYLHLAILEESRSTHTDSNYPCEDHIILRAEKDGGVTTVYAIIYYSEYSYSNGEIRSETGYQIPAVVTLDMEGAGYSAHFRWAEDGTRHVPSIKEMFPFGLRNKAIKSHLYSKEQSMRCREQAEEYFFLADIHGMNIGAEMPSIEYSDGTRFLLSGTFGLVVYDTGEGRVTHRLSYDGLTAAGAGPLCSFAASADGSEVYIGTFNGSGTDWNHKLDMRGFAVKKYDGGLPEEIWEGLYMTHEPLDTIDPEVQSSYLIGYAAFDAGESFWYLRADQDWNMSTLQLVQASPEGTEREVYDIFANLPAVQSSEPVVDINGTTVDGSDEYMNAAAAVELINALRVENGLPKLAVVTVGDDTGLYDAALLRLEEIGQSFSHTRPNGENFISAYETVTVGSGFCEALASGQDTAEKVVGEWFSADHIRNQLLSTGLTHMCVVAGKSGEGDPLWLFAACNISTPLTTAAVTIPSNDELVSVTEVYAELKYASADNFTGQVIYDFTQPSLRYGTKVKLLAADRELTDMGYRLKIWDAYRPISAQEKLWEICPDPTYVSDPKTGTLTHCRGSAVDVTLVLADGTEIPMPTGFDDFSALADRDYSDVSAEAAANAQLLESVMEKHGFRGYQGEWWHYTDTDEYPIIR